MRPDRRTILAAAAALAAAATAKAADRAKSAALVLFDSSEPAAQTFAASQGARSLAIEGDRIRLARRLLDRGGPDRLTVIGRHADVLLLSEAAREQGYRAFALHRFPAADGRDGLFIWTARRQAL
jgi:hypothetical protein